MGDTEDVEGLEEQHSRDRRMYGGRKRLDPLDLPAANSAEIRTVSELVDSSEQPERRRGRRSRRKSQDPPPAEDEDDVTDVPPIADVADAVEDKDEEEEGNNKESSPKLKNHRRKKKKKGRSKSPSGNQSQSDDPRSSPISELTRKREQPSLLSPELAKEEDELTRKLNDRNRRRKKSSSTSRRSGSKLSVRSGDYYPDPILASVLRGLQDDMHSLADGESPPPVPLSAGVSATSLSRSETTCRLPPNSPVQPNLPNLPVSQHVGQVYTEKQGGKFAKTSQRKLTKLTQGKGAGAGAGAGGLGSHDNANAMMALQLQQHQQSMTPLQLGLESQRVFRSIGIFCHGFLAGLAFWQLVMVYFLSDGAETMVDFVALYSPIAQPMHFMSYFLTVICTISILDRYDLAQLDWRQLQMLLTLRSGGLAILIYVGSLVLTLATTRLDDKLSLHQVNATLYEQMVEEDLLVEISNWKALNLCRSIGVILGWFLVALRPNTDLLYKHLKKLEDYRRKSKKQEAKVSEAA